MRMDANNDGIPLRSNGAIRHPDDEPSKRTLFTAQRDAWCREATRWQRTKNSPRYGGEFLQQGSPRLDRRRAHRAGARSVRRSGFYLMPSMFMALARVS